MPNPKPLPPPFPRRDCAAAVASRRLVFDGRCRKRRYLVRLIDQASGTSSGGPSAADPNRGGAVCGVGMRCFAGECR